MSRTIYERQLAAGFSMIPAEPGFFALVPYPDGPNKPRIEASEIVGYVVIPVEQFPDSPTVHPVVLMHTDGRIDLWVEPNSIGIVRDGQFPDEWKPQQSDVDGWMAAAHDWLYVHNEHYRKISGEQG